PRVGDRNTGARARRASRRPLRARRCPRRATGAHDRTGYTLAPALLAGALRCRAGRSPALGRPCGRATCRAGGAPRRGWRRAGARAGVAGCAVVGERLAKRQVRPAVAGARAEERLEGRHRLVGLLERGVDGTERPLEPGPGGEGARTLAR